MVDILALTDSSIRPRIAWKSVLDDATLASVSSTEVGGALQQVADWCCFTFWRPIGGGPYVITATLSSAQAVTGWAISGHDASGLIGMDYWNGSTWVVFSEVVAPGDGAVIYLVGDPIITAQLRFRFATITHLCMLWAGVDMILPEGVGHGWDDPVLAQRPTLYPEASRDGVYLGAAISQWTAMQALDVKHLDSGWVRDYWYPFMRRCSTQPFLMSWNVLDWPTSGVLCTKAKFGKTPFSDNGFIDVSVSFDTDPGTDRRMTPIADTPALLLESDTGSLLLE